MIPGKPSRPYSTEKRDAKAAETRVRLVGAALALLRDTDGEALSLDAVAKAAGVTRLTVYNQFGSRRGLLEAVFDDIARRGGLHEIADAMAIPNPLLALDRVVEIFCGFWAGYAAIGRLLEAMATDPEFAES